MERARRVSLDVLYNAVPFAGQVGGEIESMTYTDSAADNSDEISVTINARDEKWLAGWLPEKGATLRGRVYGLDWENEGDRRTMECGLFTLDDVEYSDAPNTLSVSGASKPNESSFSETERKAVWKNTSVKRIGTTIAERYGLGFTYDAEDYDIDANEQDDTDSSYYNKLCKTYGLVLKVYAKRLWVYDREAYKEKRAVRKFRRSEIKPGTLRYTTTLSGTCTGGNFTYTNASKGIDIACGIGEGPRVKNYNERASSTADAAVKLCAALNNANHGAVKLRFSVEGCWDVSAATCIEIAGYGALSGKYFVDKATHSFTRSGGFTTALECSGIGKAFHHWDVGGTIDYNPAAKEDTTSAENAASDAAGGTQGQTVSLSNTPLYISSTAGTAAGHKSGTYYLYDGKLINGRYRITNTAERCGKLPVVQNVTGWIDASAIGG